MGDNTARTTGFEAAPTDKMGWPGRVSITLDVEVNDLKRYTDPYLAAVWHAAQAANAPYGDRVAGELVQKLSFEIIRRWLGGAPAELYKHQVGAHDSAVRSAFGRYVSGGTDDRDGRFHDGVWTLKGAVIDAVLAGPPAGATCPRCGTDGRPDGAPRVTSPNDKVLDRGASGLARVEFGPGAGEVWVCRDSEACRSRTYRAAESDYSLVCARCGRLPGVAAAAAELAEVNGPVDLGGPNAQYGPVDVGTVWVCVDRGHCEQRIARGARPPYRLDREMQSRVAEIGVANAVKEGLGPAECEACGNTVAAELNAPHRMADGLAKMVGTDIAGAWRCRDAAACAQRATAGGG